MPVVRISEELFKEIQKYAEPLVDNFETALWKALRAHSRSNQTETRKPTTKKGNLTPPKDFWKPILETLLEKGGQATPGEVEENVRKKLGSLLKPEDFELNKDGTEKWVKQVNWQRLVMVHEGLISSNSPRGIWEITAKGREWLDKN